MHQLGHTRNEDRRYDFLVFVGRIGPSYLLTLSHGFLQGFPILVPLPSVTLYLHPTKGL